MWELQPQGREMSVNEMHAYLLALGIGFVAGLRSMTGPAVVSWGAHLGRLNLRGSALAVFGTAGATGICTLLAATEFVVDLMPQAPNRTEPASLLVRILTGGFSGACLCVSAGSSGVAGAVLGAMGGVIGGFAGFEARTRLVKEWKAPGAAVAIPEDLLAIGLACAIVFWG